jgi:hypothetical protein
MQTKLLAALATISLLGMASASHAGIITFDEAGLTDGQDLDGTSGNLTNVPGITYGVQVTGGANAGQALIWDTQVSHGTGDTDIEGTFDDPSTPATESYNPGNIMILGNDNGPFPNDDPDGGTIEITFSEAVSTFSINLYDTGDSGSSGVEISVNGISQGFFGGGLGDNEYGTFTFAGGPSAVTSIAFDGSGGFDDLQFTQVPTPATVGMLALGLAGLGFAARRRAAKL